MKKMLRYLLLFVILLKLTVFGQVEDFADKQVSTVSTPHLENVLAINPTNPNNILIGTIGERIATGVFNMPYYYSTDGGNTWNGGENLQIFGSSFRGDPQVFFDLNGNAYYEILGSDGATIYIAKSTNGGISWNSSSNANPSMGATDNPDAKADLSGNYPNNIYVVWSGTGSYNRIRFSRSTDSGNNFQSTPIELESTSNNQIVRGSNISIGANGEVYVFWAYGNNPETAIRFCKSTNGGSTFSSPVNAFNISGINYGDQGHPAFNGVRVNSWPSSDVDRTTGSRRGWIYVVYTDNSSGDANIYLRRSTDNGATWGSATRVNQTAGDGRQQWFPSLAIDQVSGYLFISYYNMDSIGYLTARYMAVSTDGGTTFTNIKASDSRFTPSGTSYNSIFMGDYYKTAAIGYKGYTCWSDNSSGYYQVFISKVTIPFTATIDQKLSNGSTTVGSVKRWLGSSFNQFSSLPAAPTFYVDSYETLLGDQSVISNEKYYQWNTEVDVINHHTFSVDGNTTRFVSKFFPTNSGITIQNYSIEGGAPLTGNIQFKDPWLIDYADPSYGNTLRNQGVNAPFKDNASPFTPSIGSSYKGLFLNQPIVVGQPYYSVNSLPVISYLSLDNKNHKYYFNNWSVNNASYAALQDANSASTGIMFNSTSAVITANLKGTQLSSQPDAIAGNGQRKIVKTSNGYLHQVYESLGKVWYERSTDNGATWQIMNGGQPVSGTAKQPSIDFWNVANGPVIAVAYQNYSTSSASIGLSIFKDGVLQSYPYGFGVYGVNPGDQDNFNCRPVVSINPDRTVPQIVKNTVPSILSRKRISHFKILPLTNPAIPLAHSLLTKI